MKQLLHLQECFKHKSNFEVVPQTNKNNNIKMLLNSLLSRALNISKLPTQEMVRVLRQRALEKATLRSQQSSRSSNPSMDRHNAQLRCLMKDVDGSESKVVAANDKRISDLNDARTAAEATNSRQKDEEDEEMMIVTKTGRRVPKNSLAAKRGGLGPAARALSSAVVERQRQARLRLEMIQKDQPKDERELLMSIFEHMKPGIPRGWGMEFPLHRWFGVRCNAGGALIELNLNRVDMTPKLSGQLELSRLPRSLRVLDLSGNEFTGEIDFDTLPPFLEELMIGNNHFTCNLERGFDGACLSQMMTMIDLSGNDFVGPADLTSLPPQLVFLNMSRNKFFNCVANDTAGEVGGVVDLSSMPSTMKGLDLSHNSFSGPIDLRSIPVQMPLLEDLYINHNRFSGLPPPVFIVERLQNCDIKGNAFE